jgi:regulatory protein
LVRPKSALLDETRREQLKEMLPVRITALEIQKKDATRVSIFVEDVFLLGLQLHIAQKLGLRKGMLLDKALLQAIESESIREAVRTWMLHLLGNKSYSIAQLRKKAMSAGYVESMVEEIIQEFIVRGWLNDEEFARAFVRDKTKFQKWGPNKIRQQLQQNGVSSHFIGLVLQDEIDPADQKDLVVSLVLKRKQHFLRETDKNKRKKKIIDYLLRKGFDHNSVFSRLETITQQLES